MENYTAAVVALTADSCFAGNEQKEADVVTVAGGFVGVAGAGLEIHKRRHCDFAAAPAA